MADRQRTPAPCLGELLSASVGPEEKDEAIQRLAARVEALEEACEVLSESFALEAERSRALAGELERSQRQIVILTRALARVAGGDRAGALLESGMLRASGAAAEGGPGDAGLALSGGRGG